MALLLNINQTLLFCTKFSWNDIKIPKMNFTLKLMKGRIDIKRLKREIVPTRKTYAKRAANAESREVNKSKIYNLL